MRSLEIKHLEKLILSLFVLILSSTCIFIVVQMYAAAHTNHFDEAARLYELEKMISQNTQAIQEIQNTVNILKNELMRIAFKPPKHLQTPASLQKPVIQTQLAHKQHVHSRQASSSIILAQATLSQGTLEDSDSFPFPDEQFFGEHALTMPNPFADEKSPDEYWRDIQHAARTRDYLKYNPNTRQTFLKNGAELIKKYETAMTNYSHDAASIPRKEAEMGGEDGLKAVEAYYSTEKRLDTYIAEARQIRRELDAMLEENQEITLPKVRSYTEQHKKAQYSALEINPFILLEEGQDPDSDLDDNFIIRISFFYRHIKDGIEHITHVTDSINLRTMKSVSGRYYYPDYFQNDIRLQVYQTWRPPVSGITWSRKPTTQEYQVFLSYITK
jgi:hypothetical protein